MGLVWLAIAKLPAPSTQVDRGGAAAGVVEAPMVSLTANSGCGPPLFDPAALTEFQAAALMVLQKVQAVPAKTCRAGGPLAGTSSALRDPRLEAAGQRAQQSRK